MTDFTRANFNFWTSHPSLAPHVASGLLDFALFDASVDRTLTLHHSNLTLSPESLTTNPMVVLANYLFDTLRHDVFQVGGGGDHGWIQKEHDCGCWFDYC